MATRFDAAIKVSLLVCLSVSALAPFPAFSASDTPLSPVHRKWLEEDVPYIITPKERDVFLELQSDRDRDLFIQAFWNHRDPDKTTPRNEFKEEHARRLAYANAHFRSGSSVPGWKTDRGRIYIVLGEPDSTQTFEGSSELYPVIAWFYQGMSRYDLVDAFHIVFFKDRGVGDYKIYSPTIDGPASLLADHAISPSASSSAYRRLLSIDALLARLSLSPIPGENTFDANPSLAFDRLLMDVLAVPQKSVRDDYAPQFMKFVGTVDVEYSANYRTSHSSVFVFRDETGVAFVHFLFELERLALQFWEGKWRTRLDVNVSLTDEKSRIVYQYEKNVPLELTEDQYAGIRDLSFQFQDAFPAIDGSFRLQVLAKNEASKEFTILEENIRVAEGVPLPLAPMVFAYRMEKASSEKKNRGAFRFNEIQLYPVSQNDFTPEDHIIVLTQVSTLTEGMDRAGSLRFSIHSDDAVIREWGSPFSLSDSSNSVIEKISLRDIPPAYYVLKVALVNAAGEEIFADKKPFMVSSASKISRPWISASVLPPVGAPYYPHVLGLQFLNSGRPDRAEAFLEAVSEANPGHPAYALDYARSLLAQKKFDRISAVLAPFSNPPSPEVQELLARGLHGQGDFSGALALYEEHLTRYGTNFIILNLMGDCYFKLERFAEALQTWERSLSIHAKQPEIRIRVEQLKKKDV